MYESEKLNKEQLVFGKGCLNDIQSKNPITIFKSVLMSTFSNRSDRPDLLRCTYQLIIPQYYHLPFFN